jgi:hypothetical protein
MYLQAYKYHIFTMGYFKKDKIKLEYLGLGLTYPVKEQS